MALVEPVLRQYGLHKLRNLRFRGGGVLGSAIGTGIGIGSYLFQNHDIGLPGSFQPNRSQRGVVSVSQETNGSTDSVN